MSAAETLGAKRIAPKALPWLPSPPLVPESHGAGITETMRRLLVARAPQSDAEALRILREMFPDFPLTIRLTALSRFHH